MLEEDDLAPLRKAPKPKDLTPLSIADLEAYIGALRAEIARAEEAIAAKHHQRGGAESLFKR